MHSILYISNLFVYNLEIYIQFFQLVKNLKANYLEFLINLPNILIILNI